VKSLPVLIRLTEGIRPDCAFMVHGFGHESPKLRRAYHRGASDTELMTQVQVDPIMGGTGMRVNFVRVLKEGA
jgi:thiosulfate reductase/polysulfide reductase chain A